MKLFLESSTPVTSESLFIWHFGSLSFNDCNNLREIAEWQTEETDSYDSEKPNNQCIYLD